MPLLHLEPNPDLELTEDGPAPQHYNCNTVVWWVWSIERLNNHTKLSEPFQLDVFRTTFAFPVRYSYSMTCVYCTVYSTLYRLPEAGPIGLFLCNVYRYSMVCVWVQAAWCRSCLPRAAPPARCAGEQQSAASPVQRALSPHRTMRAVNGKQMSVN